MVGMVDIEFEDVDNYLFVDWKGIGGCIFLVQLKFFFKLFKCCNGGKISVIFFLKFMEMYVFIVVFFIFFMDVNKFVLGVVKYVLFIFEFVLVGVNLVLDVVI